MEHSLHLAAKHFVQTIAPHHPKKRTASTDSGDESASDGGEDDDGDDDAVDAGDSLGKAIALVKQASCATAPSISCTNKCYRFVSRHKLGRSSVRPAIKSGSPHWSYYCGSVRAGDRSLVSLSALLNSKRYVLIFLKSEAVISLLDRLSHDLFCLPTTVRLCQGSQKNAAMQTFTWLQEIGSALCLSGMR
jgi:hypothetical protein